MCSLLLFGVATSSCLRDPFVKNDIVKEDRIVFSAVEETGFRPLESKATHTSREFLMEGPSGDSLILYVTEAPVQTRGASLSDATLSKFYVTAYLAEGLAEFMMNEDITLSEEGMWEYSPVKYWPQNGEVHFFAYADSKDTGLKPTFSVGESTYTGQFSYTLPEYDSDNAAQLQPDLMFAARTGLSKQSIDGSVLFRFYHALSAINFKIGDVPEGVTMESVKFSGVKDSGSCTLTYQDDGTVTFDWQSNSTTKTYTQSFSSKPVGAGDVVNTIADETTFMMIPQEFDEDAVVQINIKVFGRPYTIEKKMSEIHESWDPNKKYVYVISTPEEVDVEITDDVTDDNMTKQNLRIQNTGLSDAYIRVSVTGEWKRIQNGIQVIVAGWNSGNAFTGGTDHGDGIFTGLDIDENWFYNTEDDFFYHRNIVKINDLASTLFESYTLNDVPPFADAYLELSIIVQAIKTPESFWPESAVQNMNVN